MRYRMELVRASRERLKEIRPGVYVFDQTYAVLVPRGDRPAIDDRVVLSQTPPTQLQPQPETDPRRVPVAIVVRPMSWFARACTRFLKFVVRLVR